MLRHGLLAGVCLFSLAAVAEAQISASVSFDPADSARTSMDVGGAWDGTADVTATGDRFSLSVTNTSATETAYDLVLSASVPTGFTEITSSLNVAVSGSGTCGLAPSISVTRVGDDLIFDTSGYDLPADCRFSFGCSFVLPAW